MCEFSVKLEKNGDTFVIAQDIVRVKVSSEKCVFQDILRSSQETSPYLITKVDVPN
ncbi:MAG: CooT family nickel-binding protein, partial [Promethearchaeota archaeon]